MSGVNYDIDWAAEPNDWMRRQLDASPRCECGHRLYDHLSERSRCNEATKRCRCMLFHREEAK